MESDSGGAPMSKGMIWSGRVMTALPVALLCFSASMKLSGAEPVLEGFAHLGYPENLAMIIGIVELSCVIIYLIPQTAVLGAILLTGYLGGATATHVRIEEAFISPIIAGVLIWGGLFLRDARIRALIPLRR